MDLVDPEGRAISGGRVRAYAERPGKLYEEVGMVAAPRKRGCLHAVPHGALWVLAEAPGFARTSRSTSLRGDAELTLPLAPATPLNVTVLDEESKPLSSATILVEASDPIPFGKLTDARGAARFERLPPPPWDVRVFAPGYESVTEEVVSRDWSVTLRRLSSLDVRVVDDTGAGVVGASVLIAGPRLWPARRAETDATGVAKLRGLGAGSYDLSASHGTSLSPPLFGYELKNGTEDIVTLRLEPGRMVTVLVVDGEGSDARPVPSADVVLAPGGLGSFPLRGRTDSAGKVVLGPIGFGSASLGARAPDFVGGPLVTVPAESSGPIRVALVRGATVRGEVVDGRGFPVSGAEIEIVGTDRYGLPIVDTPRLTNFRDRHFAWSLAGPAPLIPSGELGVMPGPIPAIPRLGTPLALGIPAGPLAAPSSSPLEHAWVSDRSGAFVARPVTPGRVRAVARHADYVEGTSEVTNVTPAGTARVRVVLRAGGRLEGRVVDERGFPANRANVKLVAERGSFEASRVTGVDGSFAFRAVPEKVALSVARAGDPLRVALRRLVEVPEGARLNLELALPEPRAPVRLRVEDERGAPVSLAEVRVTSLDPGAPLRTTIFTDAAGRAELPDALGLALRVSVDAPRFARVERDFERAPGDVEIALEHGVALTGQVTAVRGRRAVAGAVVTLMSQGQRRTALSDADGVYRFSGVAVGPVELAVRHPEYAEARQSVEVRRNERTGRPFELPPLDLAEGCEVRGRVLDRHDRPVEGARVAVGVAPAYLPQGALPAGVALSDHRGEFVLKGLAPGSVRLAAYLAGVGQGVIDGVALAPGRTSDAPPIRLTERELDVEPTASGGFAVTLAEQDGAVVILHVAAGSQAERGGLLSGDVLVAIDGQRPASVSDARTRLAGPAGSDCLVLVERRGHTARMRVTREPVRH